jgi:predicted permease
MRILSRVRSLWNTLAHKQRLERELDDELRAAVETLAERYTSQGMEPRAAKRAAVRALDGIESVKDEVREGRIGSNIDALLLDVRYAWRGLWKAPGFTGIIVLTLALGIGANTAIFSIVHAMLLKPLPYRDADRLAFIWLDRTVLGATKTAFGLPRGPMSGPDLRDLREETRAFADVGGIWASGSIALTGDGPPEQLRGALVTTNFFQVLGAEAALGRTFRPEDSLNGAEPTVLLGWELFQRRFGADPAVVGRKIQVNDEMATVIGVVPKGFRLLLPPDAAVPDNLQAFAPFWPDLENGPRRNLFLRVVARMRPGVTIEQARADVDEMSRGLGQRLGTERLFTTVALQADDVREIRGPLLALFAGVAILLLIACVNVASLLIARAASRVRETALRLALGASLGRLLGQSLAEGLLLTALGAAAGIFAGYAGLRVLMAVMPESLSRLEASRIDSTVLAFTLGTSVVWGILFSLAPLTELMKAGASSRSSLLSSTGWTRLSSLNRYAGRAGYRARAGLVIVQIALSLVLLVSAGLLARAFVEVLRVDPGFRSDRHLTFRLLIPDRQPFELFTAELHRRLAAIPGVKGVGAISHLPYDDLPNWGLPYSLTSPIKPDSPTADARAISPGVFEALGVELLAGRFFTPEDKDGKHPVAILDDMLARQLWPDGSAVGMTLYTRVGSERVTVVGVVRHLKLRSLVDNLMPQIFVPWAIAQRNPTAYVVTSTRDPSSLVAEVKAAVSGLDPRLAIYDVRPLEAYIASARSTRQFTMVLAASFAICALALTALGVFGVLAYAVAHRRHEFGVRRALGADAGQVMREVLREGLKFAAAGSVGGLVAAIVAAPFLRGQLYAVQPNDPVSFGIALTLILVTATVACWIPAYRATRISPMDALRTE